MYNHIGVCNCGNHKVTARDFNNIIASYSELQMRMILESNLGRRIESHLPTENIYRSIREGQAILLENANSYNAPPLNELAVWLQYKWKIGENIYIKFLNRNPQFEALVNKAVNEWMVYANVNFIFDQNRNTEIRILFSNDAECWSEIGTSCRNISDQTKETMHFGCLSNKCTEAEVYATVLHEFGHALGCIHEHQQPKADIQWDEDSIIRAYSIIPTWDTVKVRQNILNKFPPSEISNSSYDRDSIMHYFFPAYFISNRVECPLNLKLSQMDKDFIGFCYPF